jgi:predicted nucleic acid-binding protein
LGVRCVGTVGVLIEAKKKGLIPLVKPSLDALRVSGFYLGDELYERVLRDAGET